MNVAELIARQNRMNLTNIKMAERLGVTPEHYSYWRNGKRPMPDDLDTRLASIEQVHQALHADNKPTEAKRLAHSLRWTLDLEPIPRTSCDKHGNPLLKAGTMYWEEGYGWLRRRTRAKHNYNDGYDGVYVAPSWIGIDFPGAADYPYELHIVGCTLQNLQQIGD